MLRPLHAAAAALTSTVLFLFTAPSAAAIGDVANIGNLSDARPSYATDINDAGVVVGYAEVPGTTMLQPTVRRGFVWSPNDGIRSLGTLVGSGRSGATDINASGTIVGWSDSTGGYERAFSAQATGAAMQNLGVSSGSLSRAEAINDHGDVAGYIGSLTAPLRFPGFLKRASDGALIELPMPAGVTQVSPSGINGQRDVVGSTWRAGSSSRAFLWQESAAALTELGTFGGTSSIANDVDDAGNIVGMAQDASNTYQPFLRRMTDGMMMPLPLADDVVGGGAWAMNDFGTIVGSVQHAGGASGYGVAWTRAGELINLDAWLDQTNPELGQYWTLGNPTAINESGQIVGTGIFNDGADGLSDGPRAFVLETGNFVPEPAGIVAIVAPLWLSLARRRRRTR